MVPRTLDWLIEHHEKYGNKEAAEKYRKLAQQLSESQNPVNSVEKNAAAARERKQRRGYNRYR